MNELFAQLFGQQPSYATALLGEEEARRLQQQAQQQGLLNTGLSLLAGAGPSAQPRGIGQLLAQGVQAGQQAYQGAYNKALQEQALKEQIAERQQVRQEQQAIRAITPQLITPGATVPAFYGKPTIESLGDDDGNLMPGAGAVVQAPGINREALAQILSKAPTLGPKLLEQLKPLMPEYKAVGDKLFQISPLGGTPTVVPGSGKRETVTIGNALLDRDTLQVLYRDPQADPEKIRTFQAFSAMNPQQQAQFLELQKAGSGTATVYNYPPGAMAPDKGTRKDVEAALVSSGERLALYNQIDAQFRPEFLQPKFRVAQSWSAIKDRAGVGLSPQERQTLSDFSQFKQNATTNINKTIKDITGAAMSESEAVRIRSTLPDPGQGLFDGDSPVEFESKMNEALRQLKLVEARNSYILRRGLSFKDVSLSDMPKLINDRAAELAKQYKVDLKNMTPQQSQAIRRQLSAEFGITAD